jgi:hypothetical protein
MNDIRKLEFDRSKYPKPLVTAEDYRQACEEFALPFIQQRAAMCANIVDAMKAAGDNKETVAHLALELKDITGFALASKADITSETECAIRDFIDEIIKLEHALELSGEFANEPR